MELITTLQTYSVSFISLSYQEALCAKVLTFKSVIDIVVKAVNFILFPGLNYRQFRPLLLPTVFCMEIRFISAMYVGLVEVKCCE